MAYLIKKYYYDSQTGRKLFAPLKKCFDFYWIHLTTEKAYYGYIYKRAFREKLNLENPQKIQEKFLWLRLNDRNPLLTKCSDKYLVRNYVKDKIGDKYLIPLVLHTKNPADISFENMPEYPVIVKTNHGCGGHTVIKNKNFVNYKKLQKQLTHSLKHNFYNASRQWQYKNIKPRILVEKYLQENGNKKVLDYKLHCYNGKVEMIEIYIHHLNDIGRELVFYSNDWIKLDMRCRTLDNKGDVDQPKNLKEMIKIAEMLATEFRFVRVDTYNLDGKIYVGEFTFTPAMGIQGYRPITWNTILGKRLQL